MAMTTDNDSDFKVMRGQISIQQKRKRIISIRAAQHPETSL